MEPEFREEDNASQLNASWLRFQGFWSRLKARIRRLFNKGGKHV